MSHKTACASFVWGSLVAAGVLLSGSLSAQTSTEPDILTVSIEELSKTKVYTASRRLENSRQAPSAVTVVTAEEIREYGWRTLADVLRTVRGFYTAYDRDYTYLGVRGFMRSGDYNSRILLLINGHRMNDNVYDSAHVGTEFPLDLDLVDHIEIVRGPSSSLFGTNAVFGVINVITRRASKGMALEVSADSSSFGGRAGRITGSVQGGTVNGLISGSYLRSAGPDNLYFPEFDSPETNAGIAHNADGDAYNHGFADLQIGSFHMQGLYSRRSKQIPTAPYDTIFDDTIDRSVDERAYFGGSYHRSLSSSTDLDVRTYYDSYDSKGYGAFEQPLLGRFTGVTTGHADWIGSEATVEVRQGQNLFTAGANYEYSFAIDQQNYAEGLFRVLDSRHTMGMAAVYGEGELNLIPKLSLHAGGRLDWFNSFGIAFSPRVAVVYSANPRTALKYIFGHAFRTPNAYENYYADNIVIVAATTSLKPEDIESHEVVLEHSFRPWLAVTAEGFYNAIEKLIDPEPDPVTGLMHFVNHGRDHSRGVEVELQAMHASGWSGRASYTFSDTTDELTGGGLANSPGQLFKLDGTAPVSRKASAGIELLYSGSARTVFGSQVDSSWLANLTFSTKPLWRDWQVSASCYNLFDRTWFSPPGPELRLAQVPQEGRTYRIKLEYRFHRESAN